MMIIETPRSQTIALIDFLLTALAWLGFLYLCASGIQSIVDDRTQALAAPLASRLLPEAHTLLAYAIVIACIGLLLFAWADYNARRYGGLDRRRPLRDVASESLAASFDISQTQLNTLHASQSVRIHHTNEGRISLLDYADARQTAGNNAFLLSR